MIRVPIDRALSMMPRCTGDKWLPNGRLLMTNARTLPRSVDRCIHKLMDQYCESTPVRSRIEWVDVSGDNIWCLHASVKWRTIKYLRKRGWSWQRWKRDKLPSYIKYKGRLIIWNGTHRMTLCRLAGRPVRARLVDMDKFLKWRK